MSFFRDSHRRETRLYLLRFWREQHGAPRMVLRHAPTGATVASADLGALVAFLVHEVQGCVLPEQ